MFWKPKDPLQTAVLGWPNGEDFTLADLLRSVAVFGASGTGKSSGSALGLVRGILSTNAGGLVLCSKPEDRAWWLKRLAEARRLDDAILFAVDSPHRFNYLAYESAKGAGARDFTRFIMTAGEVLDDQGGGTQEAFWVSLNERILFQAVVAVLAAYGKADAPSIQRFISEAAYHPGQLSDPAWQAGYHNKTLELANQRAKDPIVRYDLAQANSFWPGEFCSMDERPRSSGLLGVNNRLFQFNSGLVREMCSTTSTFSVEEMFQSRWIICDFPEPVFGNAGKVLMSGLKLLAERAVLRRVFEPGQPPCVIYADEAQHVVNSGDSTFVLEGRSHGGCLCFLSQGISNYRHAIGETATDMLIGQMAHKIFHVVDPITAKYASELAGSAMQETYGGSQVAPDDQDAMVGVGRWSGSISQGVRPLIEPREFTMGRTGGAANKFLVDSWVVRLAMPFRHTGMTATRCVWSQK